MPGLTSENIHTNDLTWLGSRRGLESARTVALMGDWTDRAPLGFVPDGTPIATDGTPYTGAPGQRFAGFLVASVAYRDGAFTHGNGVAVMDTGRVVVDRLPVPFTPPAPEDDATTFVYA